jgi:hypothetical protein
MQRDAGVSESGVLRIAAICKSETLGPEDSAR